MRVELGQQTEKRLEVVRELASVLSSLSKTAKSITSINHSTPVQQSWRDMMTSVYNDIRKQTMWIIEKLDEDTKEPEK